MPIQDVNPLAEQLELLLSTVEEAGIGAELDGSILRDIGTLAKEVYKDDADGWERLSVRFRRICNRDVTQLEKVMGVVAETQPSRDGVEKAAERHRSSLIEKMATGGWVEKYLEYTEESEAPAQFHLASALACASAAMKRRGMLAWEARDTWPNLYVLLIGPTGSRKGSAIDKALKVMVDPLQLHMLPTEGTPQGYGQALRKYCTETGQATGLIVAPEFKVLVSREKHKQALTAWLTDWYDCPDYWERALRAEEFYELKKLYVCVLGASNLVWLKDLPPDTVTGGFLPRMLLVDAGGRRFRKSRPRFNKKLHVELQSRLAKAFMLLPTSIEFDVTTEKYMDHWYEVELEAQYVLAGEDEQFRAWLDRKQTIALKLAVVWQILDDGPKDKLAVEWMKKARTLVDWSDACVKRVYGSLGVTDEGSVADAIEAFLRSQGGRARQWEIVRALRNRYRASRVKEALTTLESGRVIIRITNVVEGVVWELTGS